MSSSRLHVLLIALVVVLAWIPRAWLVERRPLANQPEDLFTYEAQAKQIRDGGWLVYFPNGFPVLMAAVPGELFSAEHRLRVLRVNAWLGALTCGAVALGALRLGAGPGLALVAGLLCAAWPNQVNYSRQVMSECLAGFTLTAAIAALAGRAWVRGGLWWGAACAVRSSLLPGAVLFGVARAVSGSRAGLGRWVVGLAVVVGVFLWQGSSKGGRAALDSAFLDNVCHAMGTTGEPMQRHPDDRLYRAPAAEILGTYARGLTSDPAHFLHQRAAAFWAMWGVWPGDSNYGRTSGAQLLLSLRFPLLLLGVWGAWRWRWHPAGAAVLAAVAGLTAVHVMLYATARHSYPVEPALILFAVSGWVAGRHAGRIPA